MNNAALHNNARVRQFRPDTAGGIMSDEFVALPQEMSADEAIARLRESRGTSNLRYYVYVVDSGGRLVGVLAMRDLAFAASDAPLRRIMRRPVVSVDVEVDQEEVLRLIRRHGYLALPVTDVAGRLLGVVPAERLIDVLEEETTEDVQRMVGAGADESLAGQWHQSLRKRMPWLIVNLVLAFAGASVVGIFQGTVAQWTVLAMYMPVVAGMGGNASAQAMAVTIRGIAVGQAARTRIWCVLARELRVGAALGIVTGLLAGLVATILHFEHGILLACLVGVSLVINQTIACAWGAGMPFLLSTLGFDPAQSATIFTTTLTDLVGFFTLLGLATLVAGAVS